MTNGAAPDDRFRKAYEFVQAPSETFYPTKTKLVGYIDIHLHVGVGRQDALDVSKRASMAGMRALLFKISMYPSVDVANVVNSALHEWGNREGISPVTCFGSLVLGSNVGGVRVSTSKFWLEKGAQAVWFPVLSSANHIAKTRGISLDDAKAHGDYLLRNGELTIEAKEIIQLTAERNRILSFGHSSPEETWALADEAKSQNHKKAVIDHPLSPVSGLSEKDVLKLGQSGIKINFCYWEISPLVGINPEKIANLIREIGAQNITLSSDSGLHLLPDCVEGLRSLTAVLHAYGVTEEELKTMTCKNPAKLLDLE